MGPMEHGFEELLKATPPSQWDIRTSEGIRIKDHSTSKKQARKSTGSCPPSQRERNEIPVPPRAGALIGKTH
ncbi:hypothetical protein ACO22_04558 [Paracoccidioides brasiliensis]|uniref:Uncharacterized protein n=1 Tax=Paracoccidioides brasiliensis TaxID=121759 RepID=A0A1D2JCU8_PARBR|nr:hypothetical protein ACO22_04558 [Paracoccidioides brasiliensis]